MSNDQPTRRPPAKSGGGAPMGSAISIFIAVVAVVVGFIILRNINDSDGGGSGAVPDISLPDGTDNTTTDGSTSAGIDSTSLPPTTTPGTAPLVQTAKIIVANASGQKGAAAKGKEELEAIGFTVGDPTDAQGADKVLPTTKVYYADGGMETAQSVAQVFSTAAAPIQIYPLALPVNVSGGSIGDAQVLVMIGKDLALKPLPAIAATAPDPTSTNTTIPSTSTTGVTG